MSDYRFIFNPTGYYVSPKLLAAASNNALLMIDVDAVPDQITITPSFASLPYEFVYGIFQHDYIADTLVLPSAPLTLTKSGGDEYGVEWTLPTAVQGTDCYFSTQTVASLRFLDNIFLSIAIYFKFQARRTNRTTYSEIRELIAPNTLYTAGQLQGYVATNTKFDPLVISATLSY